MKLHKVQEVLLLSKEHCKFQDHGILKEALKGKSMIEGK
jgi:hypothetical protein